MPKFSIPSDLILLNLNWTEFKKYIDGTTKSLNPQYVIVTPEELEIYQIIAIDGKFAYLCYITKEDPTPESSDQEDFEDNFLAGCNKQLYRTDTDRGGLSVKPTIHKIDFRMSPIGFYFNPGSTTVPTKHNPLASNIVITKDDDKFLTKVVFTPPFVNGIDIDGSEIIVKGAEDQDVMRAWIEHPSYPDIAQGYMIYNWLMETNKKEDTRICGPTASHISPGLKIVFEYYSMTTNADKKVTINLGSWLNLDPATVYTMPKT